MVDLELVTEQTVKSQPTTDAEAKDETAACMEITAVRM